MRDALQAVGFEGDDMSPRVLRNTFCRRQLLAGVSRLDVAALLGLASLHTCDRIAATIDAQL